ncbi:hypothetical protein L484_024797 [Morus notabilis]|uniref:Uncharacterized protein n=1 Tax=Morus notabilis TaxID=981085 RepID=W9RIZ4_9ROSA|nr:hypothetical protein L484_024797 [Morus notabilis]
MERQYLSYNRINRRRILLGQPWRGGFRLKKARPRLCVEWLRVRRLFSLIRSIWLCKWKSALHDHIMKMLNVIIKKKTAPGSVNGSNTGKCNMITITTTTTTTSPSSMTIRSYNYRLNSLFYSEAISDCLEYIKLSSNSSSATSHPAYETRTTALDV